MRLPAAYAFTRSGRQTASLIGKAEMDKEEKRGLKIYAQYAALIALLAGFNFYNYYRGVGTLALVAALVCVAALMGWTIFYILKFRRKE